MSNYLQQTSEPGKEDHEMWNLMKHAMKEYPGVEQLARKDFGSSPHIVCMVKEMCVKIWGFKPGRRSYLHQRSMYSETGPCGEGFVQHKIPFTSDFINKFVKEAYEEEKDDENIIKKPNNGAGNCRYTEWWLYDTLLRAANEAERLYFKDHSLTPR